jgi:hypothetical protein
MDRMGRTVRTVRTVMKDPAGDIHVDTEYLVDGQTVRVSAPYRNGQTPVWTRTHADGLGSQTLYPDTSRTVDIVDGNKVRERTRDAMDAVDSLKLMSFDGAGRPASGILVTLIEFSKFGTRGSPRLFAPCIRRRRSRRSTATTGSAD